jgi:NAD-dependent dihydropyrimidine dehydrogenase PreA subunit
MRAAHEQMYINPGECIDFRACQVECPVHAIYYDELHEKYKEYIIKIYVRFGLKIK